MAEVVAPARLPQPGFLGLGDEQDYNPPAVSPYRRARDSYSPDPCPHFAMHPLRSFRLICLSMYDSVLVTDR